MINATTTSYNQHGDRHIVSVTAKSTDYEFVYVETEDGVFLEKASVDGDILVPGRRFVEAEGAARRAIDHAIDNLDDVIVPDTSTTFFQ